jgi:hypothetical protein
MPGYVFEECHLIYVLLSTDALATLFLFREG